MINWETFRNYVASSVIGTAVQVNPDQMLVWTRWAIAELSQHTAEAAQKTYTCDGAVHQFELPTDVMDSVEKAALVLLTTTTTSSISEQIALNPSRKSTGDRWSVVSPVATSASKSRSFSYCEWPSGILYLDFVPFSTEIITLKYFKFWDAPISDSSVLMIPQWMEQPIAYLVGAYAMDPIGVEASDIRQWITKNDAGTPEHNPLHRQSEFFIKQAARLMQRVPPQDRETYFRPRNPL